MGVHDADGILRGKYMSRDKFFSRWNSGFGFCDVVLGWDSNDQLYDNASYTGWHTAYPDAAVRIFPNPAATFRSEPGGLFFLSEFAEEAEGVCPRGTLRRVLARAEDGLRAVTPDSSTSSSCSTRHRNRCGPRTIGSHADLRPASSAIR